MIRIARFAAFLLGLQVLPAFASGMEGAGIADAVRWMVLIVLAAFVTLVLGGGLLGALRANPAGDPIPKRIARGLLRGLIAFLVVGGVTFLVLTILGIAFIVYSFCCVQAVPSTS